MSNTDAGINMRVKVSISEVVGNKQLFKTKIHSVLSMLFLNFMLITLPVKAEPFVQRIGDPMAHPWGMDFLDDRNLLVTERGGNLFVVNFLTGDRVLVTNLPKVRARKQGGMLDVAVRHDKLTNKKIIYLCYTQPQKNKSATAIDMAYFNEGSLLDRTTIFTSNQPINSNIHFGCRLALDKKYLYATLGDRGKRYQAQDPRSHNGSIIRLYHDGGIPPVNPNKPGWTPETLSIGHRNPQGIAIHPKTGLVWTHEHGPRGGDEINIIHPGENFGWPKVSHGREYHGPSIGVGTSAPGLKDPIWFWTPSIAPSGMAFYSGKMFKELDGHLLIGSLKFRRLYLLTLEKGMPVHETVILDRVIGRVRDVAVAPDGAILLLSDEAQGGLYRLAKKQN